jgi:hypothetical protein
MISQILLGFDLLRDPERSAWPKWDYQTRERYLLRPEIEWPISVDRLICPSIFQPDPIRSETGLFQPLNRFAKALVSAVEQDDPPEDEFNLIGYWRNLFQMQKWLATRPELTHSARFGVCISVFVDENSPHNDWWDALGSGISHPPSEYLSLGFDVADKDQTSILSNCGRGAAEIDADRKKWAATINDFGLFADNHSAAEFRDAHSQVADHSPAYIYEIARVMKAEQYELLTGTVMAR